MASASSSQRGQNDPFNPFGDDLEMVWVVTTIMVMEEAPAVMVALVAAVVVVVGLVVVGMPIMDSVMTEAVVEVVGARIVWATTTLSLQILDLQREGTLEAGVPALLVLEAKIC